MCGALDLLWITEASYACGGQIEAMCHPVLMCDIPALACIEFL